MKNKEHLDDVVNFMIDQTARQFKQYCQKQFDHLHLNITVEQWIILKIIHQEKELTQVMLASIALKDNASITRMIDLLEKKGLVVRYDDKIDRRKYKVALTKKGDDFVIKNIPIIHKLRMKTIEGISTSEIAQLKNILQKIRKNTA